MGVGGQKEKMEGKLCLVCKTKGESINLKKYHRSLPFLVSSSCYHVVFIHLNWSNSLRLLSPFWSYLSLLLQFFASLHSLQYPPNFRSCFVKSIRTNLQCPHILQSAVFHESMVGLQGTIYTLWENCLSLYWQLPTAPVYGWDFSSSVHLHAKIWSGFDFHLFRECCHKHYGFIYAAAPLCPEDADSM